MYPAIAILDEIKKTNDVFFITDKRGYNYLTNNKILLNPRIIKNNVPPIDHINAPTIKP